MVVKSKLNNFKTETKTSISKRYKLNYSAHRVVKMLLEFIILNTLCNFKYCKYFWKLNIKIGWSVNALCKSDFLLIFLDIIISHKKIVACLFVFDYLLLTSKM